MQNAEKKNEIRVETPKAEAQEPPKVARVRTRIRAGLNISRKYY